MISPRPSNKVRAKVIQVKEPGWQVKDFKTYLIWLPNHSFRAEICGATLRFSSVQFSCSVMSNSLWPHGLQDARPPCPSPTPRAYSNSCELVMPSNHLLLFIPFSSGLQSFPASESSNQSALPIRWPKDWSFSFNISPSNEYSGLISFRMDWLHLLAVQGTLKSLLQHHSSKASIFQHSVSLSPTLTTIRDYGKNNSFD